MIPKIPTRDDFRGRFGDTKSVHVTPGEVVLPKTITGNPDAMAVIAQIFQDAGMDHRRYTVGSEEASVNPATGKEEFFDWRSIAGAFLPGLISDFLPASQLFNFDSGLLNNILDVGLGAAGHNLLTGGDWMSSIGASLGSQVGRWAGNEFFGGDGEGGDPTAGSSTGSSQLDALFGGGASGPMSVAPGSNPLSQYGLGPSQAGPMSVVPQSYINDAMNLAGSMPQQQQEGLLDRLGLGDLNMNDMMYGAIGAYLGSQLAGGGMQMPEPKPLNIPNMPSANVPQYGGGNNNQGPSLTPPSTGPSTSIGTQTGTGPSTQIGTSTGAIPTSGITYKNPVKNRDSGQTQWLGVNDPGRYDRRQGWGGGVVFV